MIDLSNLHTLEDIVDLVNNGGFASIGREYTGEDVAAQYAVDACRETGFGYSKENIICHLEILCDNNAVFDLNKALDKSISISSNFD